MKRASVITLMLLLCAVWALAQQSYPSSQSSSSQASQSSSGQTTIEGCLSRSGGNYILTDKSGTTYQLAGDTSKFSDHVGHEVQITGTQSSSSSSSSTSAGDSRSQQTITVTGFKHISETCSSSSTSGSQNQPMSEKPPTSEKPPMSEKPPR